MYEDLESRLRHALVRTVAYSDIFDYPLTSREIHRYLFGLPAPLETVEVSLHKNSGLLASREGYFTLPGRESLVGVRKLRAQAAQKLWRDAVRYGQCIARLPFVRMVAVTGALAMANVEPGADIDFLIVTVPGRLWTTRALILLIGRFSAIRGVTLCPNYLITLQSLEFTDRNEYTAHEIAQMIPIAGIDVYEQIREQNAWVEAFLPNAKGTPELFHPIRWKPSKLSRPTLEFLMSTSGFSGVERWEMMRKVNRLRGEQQSSLESNFSADCCKGHGHAHQAETFTALKKRLGQLESLR